MKAVILAGGLGSRLKPFTETIPKPLLPIGEKAILEIQMERLKEFGFTDIYLATNYKSDYIEGFVGDGSRYGVSLRISREQIPLGTAGPLKLLEKELTGPFLVMNGDILSLMDFGKFMEFSLKRETCLNIAIKKEVTPFEFGNIFFEGDRVTGIEEKPNLITWILAGIYIMTPEIFRYIPENTYYGMDLLIKDLISRKVPVVKYEMAEYWLDIGRTGDYQKAQLDYEKHFK
ncbi:MAG TPA: sugar phosphate nucleotidyltransferase [Bacteroidales bacterium]|nr:sugar phosphate nucleotidyltransferase [Bacteroidales bacterium]